MNNIDIELSEAKAKIAKLEEFKQKQEQIAAQLQQEENELSEFHQRQLRELAQFTSDRNRLIESIATANNFGELLQEKTQLEQELGKVQDKINKQLSQLKYYLSILYNLHSDRIVYNSEANSPTTLQQLAFKRLAEDTKLDKHFLSDLLF